MSTAYHQYSTTTTTTAARRGPQPPKQQEKIKCVVLGASDSGKTSLLRRYFRNVFPCPEQPKVPTVGSDFYTKKVSLQAGQSPEGDGKEKVTIPVLFQVFDTPGAIPPSDVTTDPESSGISTSIIHQVVPRRRNRNEVGAGGAGARVDVKEQQRHIDSLVDAFVGRVHGVLLVYDMTNSTSFTQLRLWHAQWRKREQQYHEQPVPILIVGNKRDLLPTTSTDSPTTTNGVAIRRRKVPQRDVMKVGDFRGKDFRYEYKVDHQVVASSNNSSFSSISTSPHPPISTITTTTTSSSTNSFQKNHKNQQKKKKPHRQPPNPRHYQIPSTFTSTATNTLWTQDGTYLHSLLGTEDRSNPDRDMVKLWCMRNGLQHVEVSALTNTTLDDNQQKGEVGNAMESLMQLVLESRKQQQQEQQQEQKQQQQQQSQSTNDPINFHQNNQNNHLHHNNQHSTAPTPTTVSSNNNNNDTTTTSSPHHHHHHHHHQDQHHPQQQQQQQQYYHHRPSLNLMERYKPKDPQKCCFFFPVPRFLIKSSSSSPCTGSTCPSCSFLGSCKWGGGGGILFCPTTTTNNSNKLQILQSTRTTLLLTNDTTNSNDPNASTTTTIHDNNNEQ